MARAKKPAQRAVPTPLPPETRTVGQLIAEAIKVYGQHFVRALPLGLVVAVSDQLALERTLWEAIVVYLVASPLFTLAYADATRLVTGANPTRKEWVAALVVGTLVFLPAAALIPWFKLAVVVWLAALGLVVPVALVERRSISESFGRAFALSRADFVHAVGSLAALVLIFGLAVSGLALLLESQADNTVRTAIFLADMVLGPILFLGAAILYVDQEARLRSRQERGKERDADVPDVDDAHGEGDPDAARQPGPAS
jgi:hypothetical protein